MKNLILFLALAGIMGSCTKQELSISNQEDAEAQQPHHLAKIKQYLKDSLSAQDFAAIDFNKMYSSSDSVSGNYFIRLGFYKKNISQDFILLKTTNAGAIMKAKIINMQWNSSMDSLANNVRVKVSSLTREKTIYLKNGNRKNYISNQSAIASSGDISSMMEEEGPAGEQTLPDVVVVGYTDYEPVPTYWYFYDGMLGLNSGGIGTSYTYGASGPAGGGSGSIPTMQLDYEFAENAKPIDVKKYLDCFGAVQEADATYTITIATDIPVDGDPSRFFNWSNATPGHTYIELYKNSNAGLIQQNIGFYPNTGWKSINDYFVPSKMVDNANHEYNARYTISVSNTQFQAALNAVQTYSNYNYNIATFNCTDFALEIFNAAGGDLYIPKYQIPGYPNGTIGSNTPQGLYTELNQMASEGVSGVEMPGVKGYGGTSHGPCN